MFTPRVDKSSSVCVQVVSELTQLDTAPSTPATTPERESPPLAGTSRRQHRGRRNSNLPSLGSSSRCCCSNHGDTDKDHDNDDDNDTDEDHNNHGDTDTNNDNDDDTDKENDHNDDTALGNPHTYNDVDDSDNDGDTNKDNDNDDDLIIMMIILITRLPRSDSKSLNSSLSKYSPLQPISPGDSAGSSQGRHHR